MKRLLITVLMVLVVLGSAFAGGGKEEKGAGIPAFDPNKQYTINIGVFDELLDGYREALATNDFKTQYPNITVELNQGDWDGHHERLVTVIAAGDKSNDIEAIDEAFIGGFINGGGFVDLSAVPFNCSGVAKQLAPFALKNSTTTEGQVIALPVDIAPAVMFYLKPLADAAGVSLDNVKSWDEFIKIGQKLTIDKNGDGTPDQYLLATPEDVALVALNNGVGAWIDKDGIVMEPKEKYMSILNLLKKMVDTKTVANFESWSEPWMASYSNGSVSAVISGAWFAGALKGYLSPDQGGEWRAAKLPGNVYVNMGGSFLGIPSGVSNDNKAAAWEVLKFLTTNPKAQLATFGTMGAFPALKSVWNDPFMNEGEEYFGGQKVRLIYADVVKNIPEVTPGEYDPTAIGIWNTAIASVVEGDLTPEEAYEQVKMQITAIMD